MEPGRDRTEICLYFAGCRVAAREEIRRAVERTEKQIAVLEVEVTPADVLPGAAGEPSRRFERRDGKSVRRAHVGAGRVRNGQHTACGDGHVRAVAPRSR